MSEIKSNHSAEETLHIQSRILGQQLKRILEQDARIIALETERNELAAQLVAVKEGGGTGQSPCAKFCESVALKKDFERLKAERDALAAQGEAFSSAQSDLREIKAEVIEKAVRKLRFVQADGGNRWAIRYFDLLAYADKVRKGEPA